VHVRRAVFALFFNLFVASCDNSTPVEVHVAPAISAVPSATAAPAAPRRPTLRHYLARTEERCEVYSVDGDQVSPAERVPCPQDFEVGERIRLAGKTCMREGKQARVRPVVCPGPLLMRELRDGGAPLKSSSHDG
jgi:hypothetical protein